jgi:hypothetical protein
MSTKKKTTVKDSDDSFIERLVELPEAQQRLVLIVAALKLPKEKRDVLIAGIAENIRARAYGIEREAAKFGADIANIADMMQDRQSEQGEASEAERRLLECCDEGLAFLMRDSHGFGRAARSESRELTCTACGAMHETDAFLRALRRNLELSDDEAERRDTLRYFADHVHRQSEELADLIEKYPDASRGIGGPYPNWSFLMFRRDNLPADYRRQADLIGLGDTCVVNSSPRVNWTLLQRYLFAIFGAWQNVNRFMGSNTKTADFHTPLNWLLMRDGRTPGELVKVCLAEYPARPEDSISDAEAELFLESFKLPPLTKARKSRRLWAERFLIPLIDVREADLEAVPAFAGWLGGDNMKVRDRKGMLSAIKEGVIRALDAMARDGQG